MQFIIFDGDFQTMGSIGVFNTLLWYRRYYSPGIFELHVPAKYFDLVNRGRYLYRNDRTELGVIREVNFMRGEKGEKTAYCKGYFAEHLLDSNVLFPAFNQTGTPETLARSVVSRYVINPADAGRKIRGIRLWRARGQSHNPAEYGGPCGDPPVRHAETTGNVAAPCFRLPGKHAVL